MLSRFANQLRNYRTYARTVVELKGMDDRMLADIGVSRGDIGRAVRIGRL